MQSILEVATQEDAPFIYIEAPKDDKPGSSPSDSKPKVKTMPKSKTLPKCKEIPVRSRARKRSKARKQPKQDNSCNTSILGPPPHLPPQLWTPERPSMRSCDRV